MTHFSVRFASRIFVVFAPGIGFGRVVGPTLRIIEAERPGMLLKVGKLGHREGRFRVVICTR